MKNKEIKPLNKERISYNKCKIKSYLIENNKFNYAKDNSNSNNNIEEELKIEENFFQINK